jgi:hypothetical protein
MWWISVSYACIAYTWLILINTMVLLLQPTTITKTLQRRTAPVAPWTTWTQTPPSASFASPTRKKWWCTLVGTCACASRVQRRCLRRETSAPCVVARQACCSGACIRSCVCCYYMHVTATITTLRIATGFCDRSFILSSSTSNLFFCMFSGSSLKHHMNELLKYTCWYFHTKTLEHESYYRTSKCSTCNAW